jgi:hypothetical protein
MSHSRSLIIICQNTSKLRTWPSFDWIRCIFRLLFCTTDVLMCHCSIGSLIPHVNTYRHHVRLDMSLTVRRRLIHYSKLWRRALMIRNMYFVTRCERVLSSRVTWSHTLRCVRSTWPFLGWEVRFSPIWVHGSGSILFVSLKNLNWVLMLVSWDTHDRPITSSAAVRNTILFWTEIFHR